MARFLTAELSDRYGLALSTRKAASLPERGPFILMGSISNPLVREYCRRHELPTTKKEGYLLQVDRGAAVAAGADNAGAFYGLQSFGN